MGQEASDERDRDENEQMMNTRVVRVISSIRHSRVLFGVVCLSERRMKLLVVIEIGSGVCQKPELPVMPVRGGWLDRVARQGGVCGGVNLEGLGAACGVGGHVRVKRP